jgi:hypothetical protein
MAGDWSALVVLVICGCCVLTSAVFGMRANFYRWWLTSLIQLDPRYNAQPEWRREANSALWWFREDDFVLRYGLVQSHPKWHRYWKRASIGGLVMPVVILVVYLSVFGPG